MIEIVIGVGLLHVALLKTIVEEWKTRGLTDTSYFTFLCLAAGDGLLAYNAFPWLYAALGFPALGLGLKLRDFLYTKFKMGL